MAEDLHPSTTRGLLLESTKSKMFCTSTPFLDKLDQQTAANAPSNDSGLGSSFTDISSRSPVNASLSTVTCRTPKTNLQLPRMSGRNCDFSTYSHSSRKLISRRSLDSCFSFSDGDLSFHSSVSESLNASHDSSQSSESHHFVRKLDLDLDIDTVTDSFIPHRPLFPKKRQVILDDNFYEVLHKFSPMVPDRLIGRRVGLDVVNVISELDKLDISCVSSILQYLEPQDLCRMSLVSRDWKCIVEKNRRANQRRRSFLKLHRDKRKERGKENAGYKQNTSQSSRLAATPLQSRSLTQPTVTVELQTDDRPTLTQQFIVAASGLKNDEKLQKCPRCRKPAKVLPVQDRGKCQNPDCKFDFCSKCSYEFHYSKDCTPLTTKKTRTDAIGTAKSKKNLKRL